MSKIIIKSNLSEKQMEADVASYFGWVSNGLPLRLMDTDEQLTGADKVFYDQALAIFMQFKVAKGIKPISEIKRSNRNNKGKEELIREFRHDNDLNDQPTFYFELRAKAKTAKDFQHNILLDYANTHWSVGFYVAPTHLDATEYYNSLFTSTSKCSLSSPFLYEERKYYYSENSWIEDVGVIPFLNEHVSIVPTERVDKHTHHYSYSKTGADIAWHSPYVVTRKPSRFSDVLKSVYRNRVLSGELLTIKDIDRNFEISGDFESSEDNFDNIRVKAELLYEQSGIKTFLLLTNKEFIKKMQQRT
ncbi:hypothetical protein A6E05_15455 [Aliivibrio sp. 1S165]|uniref:hypothetical protein n=1 Tax=unclassified Aliivibrio TaxID=2645654 RepID=UPI00080DA7E6|nr:MULTISPECIES: hypothetical protein [unclassified Aliivibrio]OCH16911.1 hypothetical protein A6E05_15455 [Aliivibrio sp. 1S165]OCH29947.1 hypothetical protein A6E06_19330 [Aliivibrio sp. 1S175]